MGRKTEDPRKFQDHVLSHMESAPCQEAITSSKSSKRDSICFVPKTINLVLSGLISSELLNTNYVSRLNVVTGR